MSPLAVSPLTAGRVSIPFERESVSKGPGRCHHESESSNVSIPFERESVSKEPYCSGSFVAERRVSIPFARESVAKDHRKMRTR